MIRLLTLAATLFFSTKGFSQSHPTIRTGRPGQAIGAYVLGTQYFQVQSGIDLSSEKGNTAVDTSSFNTVMRFGLDESFEVSGLFSMEKEQSQSLGIQNQREGVKNFHLGFRYNVLDKPNGLLPGLGIQTRFKLTGVGGDYRPSHMAPVIMLATHHKLSRDFNWTHNFGINYDGNSGQPTHIFISNISYSIDEKFGTFIEIFGNENGGRSSYYVDTGLGYIVNSDFKLDISCGWGENFGVTESFISIGFSWRTDHFKSPHPLGPFPETPVPSS